MSQAAGDPMIGLLVDGRYRVHSVVARGGMATVYLAQDDRLDRLVALKSMHPELTRDPDFVNRFIIEARAAARLSHPAVVAVFDQGTDHALSRHLGHDVVYLVMAYVPGRTLREVLRERGPLGPALALAVVEPVLAALASAHRAGLVHGDVKPENVLVADDGRVEVADFGLARVVADTTAHSRGVLLGTIDYLAPEQAADEPATVCSDVYAVGIVLYELLTGTVPHHGSTDAAVLRAHAEDDVPAPSLRAADVGPDLDDLVRRATARRPADRPVDAGAMYDEVRALRRALRTTGATDARLGTTADAHAVPALERRDTAGVSAAEATAATATPADAVDARGAATVVTRRDRSTTVVPGSGPRRVPPDARPPRPPAPPPHPGPPRPGGRAVPSRQRPGRRGSGTLAVLLVLMLTLLAGYGGWWFADGRFISAPELVGLGQNEAVGLARSQQLSVDVDRGPEGAYDDVVPEGSVLRTDPGPGDRMLRGSTMTLVISRGVQPAVVPDVTGLSLEQARAALDADRLVVGEVTEESSATVPTGRVSTQGLEPGRTVRPDSAVDLTVSTGVSGSGEP